MSRSTLSPFTPPKPTSRGQRLLDLAEGLRTLVAERWFLLRVRDALLLLALILTVVSVDAPRAVWALWWPLPLATLAGGLTLFLHEAPLLRWRHLGWLALIALVLLMRSLFSLQGPIPAAGLRETLELAAIFFSVTSLWLLGSSQPRRAAWLWAGAMALGWVLIRLLAGSRATGISPALTSTFLSALGGVLVAYWLGKPLRSNRPSALLAALQPKTAHWLCLGFFVAGFCVGWQQYLHQRTISLDTALALNAGLRAQEVLWIHSLLFGWGHGTLDRLIEVFAEPRPAAVTTWGGPIGILAMGGIAGGLLLAALGFALWQKCRQALAAGASRTLTLPAVLAGCATVGLMVGGGPRSGAVLCVLAGWLALAFNDPPAADRQRVDTSFQPLPVMTATVVALLLTFVLGLPTLGKSLQAGFQAPERDSERWRQQLAWAGWLNPFDAAIPAAQADAWRKTIASPQNLSPSLYLRVVRLYRDAEALDPYNTEIPLKLADFQLFCDRQEEAVETARSALSRRPNSLPLMNWIFQQAVELELTPLAYQILDHGLLTMPMRSLWWQRRFTLADRLGQGPLASQALSVALTADPEDSTLVRGAWKDSHPGEAMPAVPLPQPQADAPRS